MVKISLVIITFNEGKKIGRCIKSAKGIADEVVVVDSYSTDDTRSVCVSHGATFIEHGFEGFTKQKNFAVAQASHDFILALDADEYLSSELKESIMRAKTNWSADAYKMNRLNSYAGKWIKSCGWYPDTKIRLWDRRKGSWQGGLVHEVVVMKENSRIEKLTGDLLHEAYENASQLIQKMQQQYADLFARENVHKKNVSTIKILYKSVVSFFKSYFL